MFTCAQLELPAGEALSTPSLSCEQLLWKMLFWVSFHYAVWVSAPHQCWVKGCLPELSTWSTKGVTEKFKPCPPLNKKAYSKGCVCLSCPTSLQLLQSPKKGEIIPTAQSPRAPGEWGPLHSLSPLPPWQPPPGSVFLLGHKILGGLLFW